jgi:hypothetical protein
MITLGIYRNRNGKAMVTSTPRINIPSNTGFIFFPLLQGLKDNLSFQPHFSITINLSSNILNKKVALKQ